jgi:hypothetical protein
MTTLQPLEKAVAKLNAKTPIGAALRTDEWAGVPVALRERAQFSAGVESARVLQTIQNKLRKTLELATEQVKRGEAFVTRSSFVGDLRKLVQDEGLGTGKGGLTDLSSARRLRLIFDMQTQQAQEYARWKMEQDPDILDAYPAQRLVRIESREVERPWASRWNEAGKAVAWDGASKTEMVALKNSPIWAQLSRFQTPWPPFDFGSGMGVEDVDRAEAERLGLLAKDAQIEMPEVDFNKDLSASVAGMDPEMIAQLKAQFGDQVEISNGVAKWKGRQHE